MLHISTHLSPLILILMSKNTSIVKGLQETEFRKTNMVNTTMVKVFPLLFPNLPQIMSC